MFELSLPSSNIELVLISQEQIRVVRKVLKGLCRPKRVGLACIKPSFAVLGVLSWSDEKCRAFCLPPVALYLIVQYNPMQERDLLPAQVLVV